MLSFINLTTQVTANYLTTAKLETLAGTRSLERTADLWSEAGAVVMAVRRPG